MASEQNSVGINGNYAATQVQGYGGAEQSYSSLTMTSNPSAAGPDFNGASSATGSANANSSDIPKDEVGWYFVEQYYTTLSRNPEKLFLFYNKRSQYVSGTEAEKVPVCVGQKAINDHIKELDIQDCKVRVTNVDSQGSGSNIVIQVIGEISNKATPHRKFTQTFVLAEQLNGYFVLNDIFRYILEDEEITPPEEEQKRPEAETGYQEPPATARDSTAPHTLTSSDDKVEQEHDAEIVDEELEEAIKEEPAIAKETTPSNVNGEETKATEDIATTEDDSVEVADVEESLPALAEEPAQSPIPVELEPEKPADPVPSPAASPPKSAGPSAETATAPPKPSAPKTWANLVAGGNRVVTPVTPAIPAVPAVQTAPATAAAKSTPPPVTPNALNSSTSIPPAASATPSAPESEQVETGQTPNSEWQTAGSAHSKQARTQVVQSPVENSRAYIKNVTEAVDPATLRAVLSKTAEVTYLDINRQKNCAFVDFATPSGYQAAVTANPHDVNGERLYVEERRIRPGGFSPYGGPRGGSIRGGRGNAGAGNVGSDGRPTGQGRGGFQPKEGGRGGFTPRGRGGMGGRGRGGPQVTV